MNFYSVFGSDIQAHTQEKISNKCGTFAITKNFKKLFNGQFSMRCILNEHWFKSSLCKLKPMMTINRHFLHVFHRVFRRVFRRVMQPLLAQETLKVFVNALLHGLGTLMQSDFWSESKTLNASSAIENEIEIEIVNGTLSETLSESSFCNYCVSEGSYDGLYLQQGESFCLQVRYHQLS